MGVFHFILGVLLFTSPSYSFAESALEQQVTELLNEEFIFTGPNCHNTSLRGLKLTKFKRYIHTHEMKFILKNYCSLISVPQVGSLGVISLDDFPAHSFIPLKENSVFTKNGVSKKALPEIQSFSEMFNIHADALKHRCRIKGLTDCSVKTEYYSCKKFPSLQVLEELQMSFHKLSQNRESFFKEKNQRILLTQVQSIDWSKNCVEKKNILQSLRLTINLYNMASLGPEERFSTEELENYFAEIFDHIQCDQFNSKASKNIREHI